MSVMAEIHAELASLDERLAEATSLQIQLDATLASAEELLATLKTAISASPAGNTAGQSGLARRGKTMPSNHEIPSLEARVFVRAAQRMHQTIDLAKENSAALALADKLASVLNTHGLQAASDCDEQAQPFLVLQVPIETLGHIDAEAMVQMAANALGVAIEFNQERETYLVNCGEAMAQGMPLLLQEV